jgi:hypothetical protein
MKLLPIEENGGIVGYLFSCPGCGNSHAPYIRPYKAPNGASWEFDGNLEQPTFQPSILIKVTNPDSGKVMICHSFVTNGKIRFLADCTHKLAGQEVELPEVD